MFRKLFAYFLGISVLSIILFSILIIVTNNRTFNEVLTDRESQSIKEVNKTLEEAEKKIRGEIDKIAANFHSLAEETKRNENAIFTGLKRRALRLSVFTEKADEIITRFPGIQFIFLVNGAGKVQYGYPITPLEYLYPPLILQQFTEKGNFNTFAIDRDEPNNPISITFGIKLQTQGKLNGKYIATKINFSEPIRELHLVNGYLRKDIPVNDPFTGVFLVNQMGYILAHYREEVLRKHLKEIWQGDIFFLEKHDILYRENNYFVRTRSIPGTDLVIGIMKREKGLFFNELTRIQKSSYQYLLLIAFLCMVVGVILAVLSSKKIVKPLKLLSGRAEAAEKGDYETRLKLQTGDELEHLSAVMHHFITETKKNLDKLEDQLNLAKRVQKNFLPEKVSSFGETEIVFDMKFPNHVGGDYLDIVPLDDSKLAIIMADASGQSFYGAFHITMIRALTHSQILLFDKDNPSPEQFLTKMAENVHYNKIDYEQHGFDMVTFLFGILDREKHEFTFSSAGHPPAFLYNESRHEIISMENAGLPLGVGPLEKHIYTSRTFRVDKNDLLFFYSDGLIGQPNGNGEEFGRDRVKQLLTKHCKLPISELKELIFQELFSFKGESVEQTDDISVILLRI